MESPTSWTMEAHDVGALAALARRHGALTHHRQFLGHAGVSAAGDARRRSRGAFRVQIHRRPQRYGGRRRGRLAGADRQHPPHHLPLYRGQACARSRPGCCCAACGRCRSACRPHEASAREIATRLLAPPDGERRAPSGPADALPPGLTGTTGLFSFEADAALDIPAFCDALRYFKLGVSWGGHESLVVPALVTRVQAAGPNSALDFGVPERMVRLHVGLEGTEALWGDLAQAFDVACHRAE